MTVYELIHELTKYDADSEVSFCVEGYVSDYDGNKLEQIGEKADYYDTYCVDGRVIKVGSLSSNPTVPEIFGKIIY